MSANYTTSPTVLALTPVGYLHPAHCVWRDIALAELGVEFGKLTLAARARLDTEAALGARALVLFIETLPGVDHNAFRAVARQMFTLGSLTEVVTVNRIVGLAAPVYQEIDYKKIAATLGV